MDSGATKHMVNEKEGFVSLKPRQNQFIKVGNNQKVPVEGIGDRKLGSMKMKDVLFAPGISKNLLSIPQLMRKGYKTIFCGRKGLVYNDKGVLVLSGTLCDDNLIRVDKVMDANVNSLLMSDAKVEDTAVQTHLRWNRVSLSTLRSMEKNNTVKHLKVGQGNQRDDFCKACVQGKMHKLPVPKTNEH